MTLLEKWRKNYFRRHAFSEKTFVEQIICCWKFSVEFLLWLKKRGKRVLFFNANLWFLLKFPYPEIALLNFFSFWHVSAHILQILLQNHRMVGVGRDLCGSSSPTLLQGRLQQAAQDLFQAGLEYLQRKRLHNLLYSKEYFSITYRWKKYMYMAR